MNHNSELKHRLDTSFFQIIEVRLPSRGDIMQIWRTARNQFDLMDRELVQCRRVNKFTPKYKELEKHLLESLDTIEQYLTFATLLTPNHN
jgi:hypothetical protein